MSAAELPRQQRYQIELIFFAYAAGSAPESAERLPSLPELQDSQPLLSQGREAAEPKRLQESWQRLQAPRPAMAEQRPLGYLSWRQDLPNPSQGGKIRIDYPQPARLDDGPSLIGWIRLGRAGSALLDVDLLLMDQGKTYRLQQRQRMNRNEIHYFDHPMLGVIASLSPEF
ncbi:MAG: hypothetical protein HQL47_07680 [Gammaproteobacteria bacterium]|nr:hypothetical protein [Gammaproteobacteria bacterium]